MKFSLKMTYLIIFVCAFLILYQYHLSNAWLITQSQPVEIASEGRNTMKEVLQMDNSVMKANNQTPTTVLSPTVKVSCVAFHFSTYQSCNILIRH